MAPTLHTFSGIIAFVIILGFLCKPAHAFGAGNIPSDWFMELTVWKHGDIGDVLKYLPVSFLTNYGFTEMDILRVYFGNWLRDYSQVIDIMPLGKATEPTLRAFVSILGFMEFGLATEEFDVTKARLGCYRPEEHIDNPRGYAVDKQGKYFGDALVSNLDSRLRREVLSKELEIDDKTGMKNYIANEALGINTSAGYIRRKIQECVEHGRVARREGNEARRHEALICLGGLLHTLEDFAAHSNYVELVLHCLGEKDIFACVGDKSRITVPGTTNEVAPLVTGTFGSLDVFQSIIGEMDDKAAMKSQNESDLKALNSRLSGAPKFSDVAAGVASALQYVVALFPGEEGLKTDFETILETVQSTESDNSGKDAINIDTKDIWDVVEPIFSFQGKIKRFLIESRDHPLISLITGPLDKLSQLIDDLVYSALSVIIEPTVQRVREALKDGKETIEKVDRRNKQYVDIFAADSTDSDPSHSILAKDHFSNLLNPVAGRVATATTNWTTQRIVECWDSDDDGILAANTKSILRILHHPAFALASEQTFIQKTMYNVVQSWWTKLKSEQRADLRASLGKAGVYANADGHHHGDNNPVLLTKKYAGDEGYAFDWDRSQPALVARPTMGIFRDIVNIFNDMGNALDKTGKMLDDGAAEAADLISKGLDAAGDAINETVDEVGRGLKRGFDEAEEWAEEVSRGSKRLYDEATREVEQLLGDVEETLNESARSVEKTVDDALREAEEVVSDVEDFVEDAIENVIQTGAEFSRDVENFTDNAVSQIEAEARDFGRKTEEVFNDVGRVFSSWF